MPADFKRFHRGTLIIIEVTTYPGTTEELLLPMFSEKGLEVGKDYFLCFSPESASTREPEDAVSTLAPAWADIVFRSSLLSFLEEAGRD